MLVWTKFLDSSADVSKLPTVTEPESKTMSVSKMPDWQTILIVDDEAAIARGVSLRLLAAGYQTIVCPDGRMGLRAAAQALPVAVILDARLPDMDGIEFIERLRAMPATRHIPVIVLSGAEEKRLVVLAAGADAFLAKPYDRESLLAAVRNAVACPPGAA
jgi:chemosensory pili system protein ChpA (sensor histidine kinase/response regulator)